MVFNRGGFVRAYRFAGPDVTKDDFLVLKKWTAQSFGYAEAGYCHPKKRRKKD